MWIVNGIIAYALWNLSNLYFEDDRRVIAWICVVCSACNGAVVLNHLF